MISPATYLLSRCEQEARELQSSQEAVAEELQAQQQICQHLRTEVEDLEEEMEQSQQKKREVGVYVGGTLNLLLLYWWLFCTLNDFLTSRQNGLLWSTYIVICEI